MPGLHNDATPLPPRHRQRYRYQQTLTTQPRMKNLPQILDTGQSDRSRHRGRRLGAVGWVVGVDDFVAGVGFDDDVAAVVDVVVAVWAGETHFVDVG